MIVDSSGEPMQLPEDPKDARIAELERLVEELNAKISTLTAKVERDEVEVLVWMAEADRRIIVPAVRTWALAFGREHGARALAEALSGFAPLGG